MNDVEKARFNAALDLIQWLDTRIAQQVEHQLGQRLAQEREYWRTHVVDLIAAEREQLVALLEKKHEKVIEVLKADHKEIFDWVQRVLEQSKKQAMAGFDRLETRLGQVVLMRRPDDDDDEPPPSTH
jgi:dipeptidase